MVMLEVVTLVTSEVIVEVVDWTPEVPDDELVDSVVALLDCDEVESVDVLVESVEVLVESVTVEALVEVTVAEVTEVEEVGDTGGVNVGSAGRDEVTYDTQTAPATGATSTGVQAAASKSSAGKPA